jgi:hypothetical protein
MRPTRLAVLFAALRRRNQFKVQGNKLTGSLPSELGNLKLLEWLRVFGACWVLPTVLRSATLRPCLMDQAHCGAFPSPLHADNQLTGTIPASYANLNPTLTQARSKSAASYSDGIIWLW